MVAAAAVITTPSDISGNTASQPEFVNGGVEGLARRLQFTLD